ncbi:MAG TPA: oligosaccharide flippase family protein [Trebonia sp.]|jgi:O-antigen/teichoic acid export membrane protein|nr:oligosaccharide flippase family protein [Trebonia sp.]
MTTARAIRLPRLPKGLAVNAIALMAATIGAQGLGLVFWAVAAHLQPPEIVGQASAAVAALTLLSMIAQLNLTNVIVRLLPAAGRLGTYLVGRAYLVVIFLSLVAGLVYTFSGLGRHVVTGGWPQYLEFTVMVPILAVFALEDSSLTALRLAPAVAVENISTAILRVVLLPVLFVTAMGAVWSWVLPALAAAVIVNSLLFGKALPAHGRVAGTLPPRRRLLSFVAGEYAGNICATASVQVMPLIVVWRLGPAAAAYLTLPWLIASGITLVLWNVSASFVVEAAGSHGHPGALLRRSLLLWGAIVAAAVIVCVAAARPLIELVGAQYVAEGVPLLRLIGLSSPFTAVIVIYGTLVWLDQRVWLLAGFQAVAGILLLILALVLLPHLGLIAVGWAYFATQAALAAAVTPFTVRHIRRAEFGRA